MTSKSERRGIQSVEVAFRVLSALQTSKQALPLREVASRAEMTPSAANNYLVSLVRTGLAASDDRPGYYKLGPAALALAMSAIEQIDGFETVRKEVLSLRDATQQSAAVTTWTLDGPMSLYKADGDLREGFELRTGLISLARTAAGKMFLALRPQAETENLAHVEKCDAQFRDSAVQELRGNGYSVVLRELTGYTSIAAPVWDWNGEPRYALSLVGTRDRLQTAKASTHVKALLESAARATAALGGRSRL